MTPAKTRQTRNTVEQLDSISMNELDREIARTQLGRAELLAEILVSAASAILAVLRMKPRTMKRSRFSRPGAPV